MSEDLSKLKDIIRTNIRNIKEVADALVYIREKLLATEETVSELVNKVEGIESRATPTTSEGIRMFGVASNESAVATSAGTPDLDVEESELGPLIAQHPKWLRPFSVQAELEKHDLEVETLRLRRSSTGYLRILRLSNGSEWGYIEEMSYERYARVTLLKEVFEMKEERSRGPSNPLISNWKTAWVFEPMKLQSLQRGARWEILQKGILVTEGAE